MWCSDESIFHLQRADGRARVYRRQNERFVANCIQEVDRFSGGSFIIWGAISVTDRTNLVHVHGTLTSQRF